MTGARNAGVTLSRVNAACLSFAAAAAAAIRPTGPAAHTRSSRLGARKYTGYGIVWPTLMADRTSESLRTGPTESKEGLETTLCPRVGDPLRARIESTSRVRLTRRSRKSGLVSVVLVRQRRRSILP